MPNILPGTENQKLFRIGLIQRKEIEIHEVSLKILKQKNYLDRKKTGEEKTQLYYCYIICFYKIISDIGRVLLREVPYKVLFGSLLPINSCLDSFRFSHV